MRTSTRPYRLAFLAALGFIVSSRAGLQIPYTPDANTLHLWHFDGPSSTNATLDAVIVGGITLTNEAQTVVPGSTIALGNTAAFPQLGTSLRIVPTNTAAGNTYALAVNREFLADTTAFRNPESGAFTFEALVKLEANPGIVGNGNWEIISGDNSPGTGQSRGWQFRIQSGATPSLNFNFITGGGGNYTANLPTTGPNAVAVGQWYHAAATYTGNNPTNGDSPGVLTFYWTLLDANRTQADVLAVNNQLTIATLGGTPVLAVGGNARNNNGTANGEGFKGSIDEARISQVARLANEMAFVTGGALNPPSFAQQPPTNTLVGFGKTLSLPTLVVGTQPITYQWQQNSGTGYTNVDGQTESALIISNVTFAAAGNYRLVAANSISTATSTVAQVVVGATFTELFNTGVAADGSLPMGGLGVIDPHYQLTNSSDPANLGPNTTIWDMTAYPVLPGGIFALVGGASQWIGPAANNYTSPQGQYVYRTRFVLDSVNLAQPITLSGTWWQNTSGIDIRLNGVSTGIKSPLTNSPNFSANFTITNGFVAGLNTLDFVTLCVNPNGSYPESAVRIELSGIGQARPPGLPAINAQPAPVTVRDGGPAAFSVVALGRPPLAYQWYADNGTTLVIDATSRTLAFNPAFTGAQGTNFQVVVSNDSGSVTSSVASLTLTTNRPPAPVNFNLATYSNQPVNLSIATIVYSATDADGDPIAFAAFDLVGTNGLSTVVQNGINLTYTPPLDYVGSDAFTYTLSDGLETSVGNIVVSVLPLLSPTVTTTGVSGSNFIWSGTGGAPGCSYQVLSSTNVAAPLTQWTAVQAGVFGAGGSFNITNTIAPGVPANFYIIQVP